MIAEWNRNNTGVHNAMFIVQDAKLIQLLRPFYEVQVYSCWPNTKTKRNVRVFKRLRFYLVLADLSLVISLSVKSWGERVDGKEYRYRVFCSSFPLTLAHPCLAHFLMAEKIGDKSFVFVHEWGFHCLEGLHLFKPYFHWIQMTCSSIVFCV